MNINISDQIQILISLLTLLSIGVAMYFNSRQLIIFKRQLGVSIFSEYTKRFHEISLNLPGKIFTADFSISQLPEEETERILKYMRAYFNLCSEEFYLNKKNLVDPIVWQVWEKGILVTLNCHAFREAWKIIKKDDLFLQDFRDWVDRAVASDIK